jgi:site-specific recombinase XerD
LPFYHCPRRRGFSLRQTVHCLSVVYLNQCLLRRDGCGCAGIGIELKALQRHYAKQSIKSAWVFVNERGEPFGRMGIARMIERAGETAKLAFPVHVHMVRHSTGYALANRGMDTRRLQHFLGHASITNTVRYTAMSPEPFKDIWR